MTQLDLTVQQAESTADITVPVERIANAGWAGRDQEAVAAHMQEYREDPELPDPPEHFPVIYPKPNHQLLTSPAHFELAQNTTSGEVEAVLIPTEDEIYVGVGSDHTDRNLAGEQGVVIGKSVCPNVVGSDVWRYDDVKDHWDELTVRSWTSVDGERTLYQDGSVTANVGPEALLEMVEDGSTEPVAGTAIFGGSVATETDGEFNDEFFEAELHDPVLDRSLTLEYTMEEIGWVK